MNRDVASDEEASLDFSLVLSCNGTARGGRPAVREGAASTPSLTVGLPPRAALCKSLRADFREDRAAQPHERPAVFRQFLGHCERVRGDDRDGAAQLQFLPLGRDRIDREADRDRACPIALARERGAAAELFGEAERLRGLVENDHQAVFERAAFVFAVADAFDRTAVGALREVHHALARRGPQRAFAPDVLITPLADKIIDRLFLLRLRHFYALALWPLPLPLPLRSRLLSGRCGRRGGACVCADALQIKAYRDALAAEIERAFPFHRLPGEREAVINCDGGLRRLDVGFGRELIAVNLEVF